MRLAKYNELEAIGKLKVGEIAQWRQERLNDITKNMESPLFRKATANYLKDSADPALLAEFINRLRLEQRTQGYADALLLDLDGRILLAAKDNPGPVDAATMKAIAQALEGKQAELSEFFRSLDGDVYIDAVAPVSDANNQPIAIVVLRTSAKKYLHPLIQSWPIPSRSAETVLVRKEGDDVLFLNELRHQAGSALSVRIPLTRSDSAAVQAVRGKQGMFEGKDYRGVEVIAYLVPVPDSPWFMVAKLDASEILAETRDLVWAMYGLGVLFVLLAAAILALLYRQGQVGIYKVLYASEQEKNKDEARFQTVTDAAQDAILMMDTVGQITLFNMAAERVFGWSLKEALGKDLHALLVPKQYHDAHAHAIGRFRETGEGGAVGKTLELRALRKDGSEFPIELSLSGVQLGGGWHAVGIIRDITERKRAEDFLKASEEKYRALIEATETGYLILDGEGKVIDANSKYVHLTGRRELRDILGKPVTEWTAEYEKEKNAEAVARCTKDGFVRNLVIDYEDGNGRITPVEINATVVRDGTSLRIISLCRDITERRRTEKEQLRAYRREGVINEILGLSLAGQSIEATLEQALELIMTASDLEITHQGAVFLVDEGTDTLVLSAQRGLAAPLLTACARVPFGWCLCGRAASTGDVQFASCVDDRHDITFDGIRPHGHICVPMRIGKKMTGVLNLYVGEGQARDEKLEQFLAAAANVLASVVARQKAEDALRESEKRFMDVLYASNDAILLIGNETFVDCNEATACMLGYSSRDQFLMTHPSKLSPPTQPDGRGSFEKANEMMQTATEKGFHRFEWVHRRANGEDFPVEVSLTPISFQGKTVLHCLWRDITAYKQAEQAFQQSEERHRVLFNSATDAIMTIEPPSWKFTSGNPACVAMFGLKNEEEFTLLGPWDLSPEHQPGGRPSGEQAKAAIETAMREGSFFFEWTHKRMEGEEFPTTVILTRLAIREHSFLQATVRDITKQKQMEMELTQAQKLESIGRLAAGIAHEINTPTQYVGDNIEFLQIAYESLIELAKACPSIIEAGREGPIPVQLLTQTRDLLENTNLDYLAEQVPRAIEQSLEGIGRIATIVQAMKEFSHPGVVEKTTVDLNQCIRSTTTVSHNEWKYVADIELDLDDGLPQVLCLPGEFNQAILNMIVNAAHAISDAEALRAAGDVVSDGAEHKGKITISTRQDGAWAEIRIADTGTGIPEEIRALIFDPFFTTKEVGRGTGQGLAITRNVIVDKHGGTISVASEVSKGTTFIIRLPIENVDTADGALPSDNEIG